MHEPLVLILIGFGTHPVPHRATHAVLLALDRTMLPPPNNLGQVGPCIGGNKKQSPSTRSPCTLRQEELVCRSCSQAGMYCAVCRTNPGWHLEFKLKTVTNILSLPGTPSVFMLCTENTHMYLTALDIPGAVTEVRSMGDNAPSPADCPLRQFCHGNSIAPTVSDVVFATAHVPAGLGIILRNVQFCLFAVRSAPNPQFSATRRRVLWYMLNSPSAHTPRALLCGAVLRLDHSTGKTIPRGFQGGNAKEGGSGPAWQRR